MAPPSRAVVRRSLPTFHTVPAPGQVITMLEIKPDGTTRRVNKVVMRITSDHADPTWGSAQLLHDFHQGHMPDLRQNLGGSEGWNKRQAVPINIVYEKEKHRVEKYLVYFSNHTQGPAHILTQEGWNPAQRYPVFGNIYVAFVNTNSVLEKSPGSRYIQNLFANIPGGLENGSNRDIHRRFVFRAAEAYFNNSENVARPWEAFP